MTSEDLKIHLRGSFFERKTLRNNIKEVKTFINRIHNTDFIDDMKISRLDLAFNEYHKQMLNFYIVNTYNSEVTEIKKDGYTQTLYIGKRENKAPFYCVYDKRFDKKGHMSAIRRFGTTEFLRHEWRLKRDYLREREINTIDDLRIKKLYIIGDWLMENKSINFISPSYLSKTAINPPKSTNTQEMSQTRLHKQIKGIYKNHFNFKEFIKSQNDIKENTYNG